MKLRTRVATVIATFLVLAGAGAGVHANAASADDAGDGLLQVLGGRRDDPRGCLVSDTTKIVICIPDLSHK